MILTEKALAERFADPAFLRTRAALLLACNVGFQLRYWRVHRGLSVAELAALSGASVHTITDLESGEYMGALSPIATVAHALRLEIDFRLEPLPVQEFAAVCWPCGHPRTPDNTQKIGKAGVRCRQCRRAIAVRSKRKKTDAKGDQQ